MAHRMSGCASRLAVLLFFCLIIPSNWTQDVPAHYATRHRGTASLVAVPEIDTAPALPPGRGGLPPQKKP